MVVESLAQRWSISLHAAPAVRVGAAEVNGQRIMLVQPQMFMNRSGEVLATLAPDGAPIIAAYDDLDLAVGRVRVRAGGGSGGHRGVASLVEHVGPDFLRIRIGIGRPPAGMDVAEYVLAVPSAPETALLDAAVARAAEAVECIVSDGPTVAMNRFNGLPAVEP